MKPGLSRIPALIFTGLAAGAALSCSRSETPRTANATNQIRTVRTVLVATRPMERIVTTTGSLAAHEAATLSVKIGGRLKNLPVDIGTVVKKGDLIAQVEPRDYELRMQQSAAALAQSRAVVGLPLEGDMDQFEPEKTSAVKQAKAVLDEASKNRERIQSLSKEGIAPPSEVDTVEAAYKVAFNRYDAALEETRNRQGILAQRRAGRHGARVRIGGRLLLCGFLGRTFTLLFCQACPTPIVRLPRSLFWRPREDRLIGVKIRWRLLHRFGWNSPAWDFRLSLLRVSRHDQSSR